MLRNAEFTPIQSGFTLIELLVAIAVVAILSATVLVAINPAQKIFQAKDSRRKADISAIKVSLENYFAINGTYPTGIFYSTSNQWIPPLITSGEMKAMPIDPTGNTICNGGAQANCYTYYGNDTTTNGCQDIFKASLGQYFMLYGWQDNAPGSFSSTSCYAFQRPAPNAGTYCYMSTPHAVLQISSTIQGIANTCNLGTEPFGESYF